MADWIDPRVLAERMRGNGTAHVAEEMREPVRPLRAAEMSSQQRNALLDEMVAVVNRNARALAELRRVMEARDRTSLRQDGQLAEALTEIALLKRTLWQRLRESLSWLFAGGR